MTISVFIDAVTNATGSNCAIVTYAKNANTATPLVANSEQYFLNDPIDTVFGTKLNLEFLTTGVGGVAFTFAGNVITGGTITDIRLRAVTGDVIVARIDDVSIDAVALYTAMVNNDVAALDALFFQADDFNYIGADGKDTFTAGNKNDQLNGKGGIDTLNGREGNDSIAGGTGNDILDGGTGIDTLDYALYLTAGQNLSISLGALDTKTGNVAQSTATVKNGAVTLETDIVKNFENVFGSLGNDTLTGNAGANHLFGREGDDLLTGGAGADKIEGSDVGDVNGDTTSYATSAAGVFVNLNVQDGVTAQAATHDFGDGKGAVANGDAAGDILSGIEHVTGSGKNDVIVASGDINFLNGGLGTDTVSYANSAGVVTIDLSKQFTVAANGVFGGTTAVAGIGGDAQGDKLAGFENIIGGIDDDDITGTSGANVIEGGAGADKLTGNGGNDTVSYAGSATGVSVELDKQDGVATQANGDAAGDILQGFTNLIGSESADVLYAVQNNAAVGNTIRAGGGFDYIQGGLGKDIIFGGDGDDEAFLGLGKGGDTYDGGVGEDYATFNSGVETAGITIALGKDGTLTGFSAAGGAAAGTKLTNVENVGGTTLNDKLTGNNLANKLDGGATGNDIIDGGAGDDVLEGADDDDRLIGGVGADILDGGNGFDTISYALSAGVTVNLTTQGAYIGGDPTLGRDTAGAIQTGGDAQGDTLWGIDNIIGSAKNDVLTATGSTQFLDGGVGDDVIGVSNGEILLGGTGMDTLSFATLASSVSADLTRQSTANATRTGVTTNVEIADGYRGAEFENLVGGTKADELTGNASANIIEGGAGADALDGNGGLDTVSYVGAASSIFVDLSKQGGGVKQAANFDFGSGSVANGDAADDELIGFVNLTGSANRDVLYGSATANIIQGGKGDDDLSGAGGIDKLFGGEGADNFLGNSEPPSGAVFDAGADIYDGGDGLDMVLYDKETGAITITLAAKGAASKVAGLAAGAANGDTLISIEDVFGGSGSDVLTGNEFSNGFFGADGEDKLSSGGGSDTLNGGAGNDVLNGGTGGDFMDGGADKDTVTYATSASGVFVDLGTGGQAATFDFGDGKGLVANGDAASDTFSGIESLIGSKFADVLRGNNVAAFLGKIDGLDGNDTIFVGSEGETLLGGAGTDTIDFSRLDMNNYGATFVIVGLSAQGTVNATRTTVTGGTAVTGGFTIAEFENVVGTNGNDQITGNSGNNVIDGGDGVNNGGADLGNIIDGGLGTDTVSYKSRPFGGISLSVTGDVFDIAHDANVHDTVSNVEIVAGSTFGDFFGIGAATKLFTINGGGGDDKLQLGAKGGIFNGEAGDDVVLGGTGRDTLDGGTGGESDSDGDTGNNPFDGDLLDYSYLGAGQNLTLTLGAFDSKTGNSAGTITSITGLATDVDSIKNFEHVSAGSGNDTLTGNARANTLVGGDGQDILSGGDGGDVLEGGNGNDTLTGGAGTDTLTGGAGNDLFKFLNAAGGSDTVLDFDNADDLISIVKTGFGIGTVTTAAFAAQDYVVSAAGHTATAAHAQFLFDEASNELWFDSNGTLAGGTQTLIATLTGVASLSASDFELK